MMIRTVSWLTVATLALFGASAGTAQEERGRIISIGGGAQVGPDYPGADGVGVFPLPIIGFRREGARLPLRVPDAGLGFGLLGNEAGFDFGPVVQFQAKRQDEDVGAPVGDVGFTVEAGAFAELYLGERIRLRAEGRRGIGGHEGWVGDLGTDFVLRDRDTYVFSVGPRARLSDDRYQRAYFGVTPAVAAATGLPAFAPDGGFHAVGAVTALTHMLSRRWGVYAFAGYDRLVGDAADSPIVRSFGSRNQYSGGLGVFYNFTID